MKHRERNARRLRDSAARLSSSGMRPTHPHTQLELERKQPGESQRAGGKGKADGKGETRVESCSRMQNRSSSRYVGVFCTRIAPLRTA
jgi:hypothetical protein